MVLTKNSAAKSRKKESLTTQFGEESERFYPIAMNLTDEEDVRLWRTYIAP